MVFNIDHLKEQFIRNPNHFQEFAAAPILTGIQDEYVQYHFGLMKWYECNNDQQKQLKQFMDRHIYRTI